MDNVFQALLYWNATWFTSVLSLKFASKEYRAKSPPMIVVKNEIAGVYICIVDWKDYLYIQIDTLLFEYFYGSFLISFLNRCCNLCCFVIDFPLFFFFS